MDILTQSEDLTSLHFFFLILLKGELMRATTITKDTTTSIANWFTQNGIGDPVHIGKRLGKIIVVDYPMQGGYVILEQKEYDQLFHTGIRFEPTFWWEVTPKPVERDNSDVADISGWYEFIKPSTGTIHIAQIDGEGSLHLPWADNNGVTSTDFLLASVRGEIYRLVREVKS